MATFFYDRFFEIDPANPPAVGTPLTALRLLVEDNNDDGDVERKGGDQIDGTDISSAYPNSSVTVINGNGQTITYVGVTFHLRDGASSFRRPTPPMCSTAPLCHRPPAPRPTGCLSPILRLCSALLPVCES